MYLMKPNDPNDPCCFLECGPCFAGPRPSKIEVKKGLQVYIWIGLFYKFSKLGIYSRQFIATSPLEGHLKKVVSLVRESGPQNGRNIQGKGFVINCPDILG